MKYVIKNTSYSYDAYWNEEQKKWGGLLQATRYTDTNVELPENGQLVDYFVLIGVKKNV